MELFYIKSNIIKNVIPQKVQRCQPKLLITLSLATHPLGAVRKVIFLSLRGAPHFVQDKLRDEAISLFSSI
jgi:hypothetical protein